MSVTSYLGIDLGTTNTAAAVFDGTTLTVVRNADGSSITPSVVRIDGRSRVTVGERARRLRDTDPDNVRGEFKRVMGTEHAFDFPASKSRKKPEELAAEVLRAVREDANRQLGFLPARAVVTVPALFELPQIAATSEAARLAGFAQVEMLQEPVASAVAAGWKADVDDALPWLVYDLGGGTFDVSLLETQDGMLRVVGHDGDNFLGGRDLDAAVVEWCLHELAAREGVTLRRDDPRHAPALRRIKHAAEECRIELSHSPDASLTLAALDCGGEVLDVDLVLTRAQYESLVTPMIDRTVAICRRLMARHGLRDAQLSRVVLVGGPTVTPVLRARVTGALGAPAGVGLDPMTLVAQGAALHAASMGFGAQPVAAAPAVASGPRVWLQYPAMSSDLSPWVIGRVVDGPQRGVVSSVRITRPAGQWASAPEPLDAEGTFSIPVELVARSANEFRVEGADAMGLWFPLDPPTFTVVHGVTLGDPPLSRSIGVALAHGGVQVFLERGAPLPMRRTHTLRTVEAVSKGATGFALDVPIVQGEYSDAHLCRLVGTLRIAADALPATLPVGSAIELTVEVDRGGRLRVSARVPAVEQVFDEVARLVAPRVPVEDLRPSRDALWARTAAARSTAGARGAAALSYVDPMFVELDRDIASALGGEADAAERARRTLTDIDGMLAEIEAERAWPEMASKVRARAGWAMGWVAEFGSDAERKALDEAVTASEKALTARNAAEVARQEHVMIRLGTAAFHRAPGAWDDELAWVEGRVAECTDPRRAAALVRKAHEARARGDVAAQAAAVREVFVLLPPDAKDRARAYGSGVR